MFSAAFKKNNNYKAVSLLLETQGLLHDAVIRVYPVWCLASHPPLGLL